VCALEVKIVFSCTFVDCIHVFLQKDVGSLSRRSSIVGKPSAQSDARYGRSTLATVPLEDFCGIECGFELDREEHVMSLICRSQVLTFAFHNQQTLEAWKGFVRRHLGEGILSCAVISMFLFY
jgi:hypothetical protein